MLDIDEVDYGDYVKMQGRLFFVYGTDRKKKTVAIIPTEMLDIYAHDEELSEATSLTVPVHSLEKLSPAKLDTADLQALFRLDVTPWALAANGKYPFSPESGKYRFTEEDLLRFLENLRKIRSDIVTDAWSMSFGGQGSFNHAIWPELTEPGLTFYFLAEKVWTLMDWLILSEDNREDWAYIYELRDCYLQSKGCSLADTILPEDFKYDMLANIKQYAEKHELTDEIRQYYTDLLEQAAAPDDEAGLKLKAYAYYGGDGIVPCSWEKSESALLQAFALSGDPRVANSLGYIYYSDRLGAPDYEKAFYYFNYACSFGVTEATYKLSDLFRHGHGVQKDPVKAWQLLSGLYEHLDKRRKSRGKYPDICLRMGYCFRDGIGVEKDSKTAMEYFEKARQGITARIRRDKGYGDEKVLANVLRAIESVQEPHI